jgi:hypothetical protein
MSGLGQSEATVVGTVEPKPLPVTVRREPEVGIAWEACCDAFGLCALGRTPGEAADNLGRALKKRGLVEIVNVDRKLVNALVRGAKS